MAAPATRRRRRGSPVSGEAPLDAALRETSDAGRPIVASAPDSVPARAFSAIAARMLEALERGGGKPAPRIVVE